MPGKNIADYIRSLLDKNNGFMTTTSLAKLMSLDAKNELGIRKNDIGKVIRRKIEQSAEGSFIFRTKGRSIYILVPCEPSEFVLGLLSESKPFDAKTITSLPFTKAEFYEIVNDLADKGLVKTKYDSNGKPKLYKSGGEVRAVKPENFGDGEYTPERFREAFENCDKGRSFVRIFKMRRYLNWPREVFDDMVMNLLRGGKIFVHPADPTVLAKDEYDDSWIDEFGHMKGTMTWNE